MRGYIRNGMLEEAINTPDNVINNLLFNACACSLRLSSLIDALMTYRAAQEAESVFDACGNDDRYTCSYGSCQYGLDRFVKDIFSMERLRVLNMIVLAL